MSEQGLCLRELTPQATDSVRSDQPAVTAKLPCLHKRHLVITPTHSTWTHDIKVDDQKYARGVYKAIAYTDALSLSAQFKPTDAHLNPTAQQTLHWEQAQMLLPISDLRGIYHLPVLNVGTTQLTFEMPTDGTTLPITQPYVFAKIGEAAKSLIDINIQMELDGLQALNINPLGQNIKMSMQANWPHPQFSGEALPYRKSILADRFSADWKNNYLAMHNSQLLNACLQRDQASACQQFNSGSASHGAEVAYNMGNESTNSLQSFRIGFIDPINIYSLTDRTLKYAALFIVMMFGVFFLFEVLKDLRVHPIQYALVGAAQAVFYLLLLSFSEQFAFGWAYLGSSLACVGLIGWYVSYVLHGIRRALGLAAMLASMYGALYVILQSQQHTLILGSVLVFVVIGIVMYLTRHIDWYQLGNKAQ
ncbi:MAG: cell envelope integrity protein CreD, partial [Pseudomonadota bacterium]|nr:cell envelope integrity protein CreD [Pseudomonadota bacterium]